MKPQKQKVQIQEIRRAAARIDEINHSLSTFTVEKLPKKMFAGYWRFFTVRADVLRSSIGSQIQRVVNQCNHWVLGAKKGDEYYRCHTEVRASDTESTIVSQQLLRPLSQENWDKANFPEFFKRKWFATVTTQLRAGTKNIPIVRYYPQIPRHMIEFGYKKGYITEVTIPKGDIESELAQLQKFMEDNNGYGRLGQSNRERDWDLPKRRAIESLQKREIEQELASPE